MGMRRSEIAGEFVQRVVTNKNAGRHVQYAVFGIKPPNSGPSARRITFTENFLKIAVEQGLDTTHVRAHGQQGAPVTRLRGNQRGTSTRRKQTSGGRANNKTKRLQDVAS